MKNKTIILSVLALSCFLVAFYIGFQPKEEVTPTNYKGLVLLNLAPNSEPREPTSQDIDTGLNIGFDNGVYRLYESRTWETLDYGKTFVRRIA